MNRRPLQSSPFGLAVRTLLVLLVLVPGLFAQATILPESFLRGYDPITIQFPGDKGPRNGGPEDHPERFLRLEPSAPGEFRWVDARTLLFKPAVPWPALEKFKVSGEGLTRTLHTLMVRPSQLAPAAGSTDLEAFEEITLTFPEPLAKEKLARMVVLEVSPFGEKRLRRLTTEDFAVKALERGSINDPASYAIRLKQPILGGHRIRLKLRLSLDEKAPESYLQYAFATRIPFRVVAMGCAAAVPGVEVQPSTEEGEGGGEAEDLEEAGPAPQAPAPPEPGGNLLPLALAGSRFGADQALDCATEPPGSPCSSRRIPPRSASPP